MPYQEPEEDSFTDYISGTAIILVLIWMGVFITLALLASTYFNSLEKPKQEEEEKII